MKTKSEPPAAPRARLRAPRHETARSCGQIPDAVRDDEVDAVAGDRQVFHRRQHQAEPASGRFGREPLSCAVEHAERQVDPGDGPALKHERNGIGSGAAADVQQRRAPRHAGWRQSERADWAATAQAARAARPRRARQWVVHVLREGYPKVRKGLDSVPAGSILTSAIPPGEGGDSWSCHRTSKCLTGFCRTAASALPGFSRRTRSHRISPTDTPRRRRSRPPVESSLRKLFPLLCLPPLPARWLPASRSPKASGRTAFVFFHSAASGFSRKAVAVATIARRLSCRGPCACAGRRAPTGSRRPLLDPAHRRCGKRNAGLGGRVSY